MKRRTYNNMVKATKMIANKGYEWNLANEIAMKCFDNAEQSGMSVEFFIQKIRNAEEK